jgi:Flp pilus assembly protein TadB
MFEQISGGMDPRVAGLAMLGVLVLLMLVSFGLNISRRNRQKQMAAMIVSKTESAAKRASSVIMDAESRALRDSGRDAKRAFDLVNWRSIQRDLKRAGLPNFPPFVFLAAAALSYAVAYFIIAAPIAPIYYQAAVIFPPIFLFVRSSILGMFIDSRRMKMTAQLVVFIESVQRAVSVGTSADEAVGEAIGETEAPLKETLVAIKDLLDLGYDFVDAINLAADRINLAEFDIFCASLTAQSATGGSVGDVLKEVTDIARGRMDLKKKIATMTAEGRFNAMLLGSLPVMLSMYLRAAQPDYFNALWISIPVGPIIFFGTLAGAVLGAWLAMRIARISI